MQIELKLMGALKYKLKDVTSPLELEHGTSISQLLIQLGLTSGHVQVVLVNEEMEPNRERALSDKDVVTFFPPLAGG